jgi:hypothetical protein
MVLSFSWRGFPPGLRGPSPRRLGTATFAPYPLGRARRPPKENGRIAEGPEATRASKDKWAAQRVGAAAIGRPRERGSETLDPFADRSLICALDVAGARCLPGCLRRASGGEITSLVLSGLGFAPNRWSGTRHFFTIPSVAI